MIQKKGSRCFTAGSSDFECVAIEMVEALKRLQQKIVHGHPNWTYRKKTKEEESQCCFSFDELVEKKSFYLSSLNFRQTDPNRSRLECIALDAPRHPAASRMDDPEAEDRRKDDF